jgi:hypothetical protein
VIVEMYNRLAKDVEEAMGGFLGGFMAHIAVKKCCEKMGVSPDTLEDRQLPELADRIERFVHAGLGEEEAILVASRVRALVPG